MKNNARLVFGISLLISLTSLFSCGQTEDEPFVKKLDKITIANNAITKYTVGDTFIAPTVTATYNDSTTKKVQASFSGYDMSKVGDYTVMASYTEESITKTATYGIEVADKQTLDVKDIDPLLKSSDDYLKFFNHTTTLSISITMSKEAANFMNNYQTSGDTYFHDYYVPCDFTLIMDKTTITYDDVGIRVKGNLSRQRFLDNNKFSNDNLSHFKLKFNETFDGEEYDTVDEIKQFKKTYDSKDAKNVYKKRTLFDMEKLDLKWNRNFDETKSKQGYFLKTCENNGVLSGKSTLSQISLAISGTNPINKIYEVLEDIDDIFISRHFKEEYAQGDLYKCCWQNAQANFNKSYTVGKQIGVENNVERYHPAYDLKTNKKKSDHSALLNLIKVMNKDTLTTEQYKQEISKIMDMKSFLMYEALAFLAGNFDDLRNNGNNYYLYFVSGTNYAYIIPYDFDRCFGCGTYGVNDYMTGYSADSTKMQCDGSWQNMSIYWRTVCRKTNNRPERIDDFYNMYTSNIEKLLNESKIGNTSFTAFVNEYPNVYECNPNGAGYGNITFQNYLDKKIRAIKQNNSEIHIN